MAFQQIYSWPLSDNPLRPGSLIRIRGNIQKDGKRSILRYRTSASHVEITDSVFRFDVNLQSELEYSKSDLVLHISVRYSDGVGFIVNNSKDGYGWMDEEMHRHVQIEPGTNFELLILCDDEKYQIALNGNHICNYDHKIPCENVKCLSVKGDVIIGLISSENNNHPELTPTTGTHYPLPFSSQRRN